MKILPLLLLHSLPLAMPVPLATPKIAQIVTKGRGIRTYRKCKETSAKAPEQRTALGAVGSGPRR